MMKRLLKRIGFYYFWLVFGLLFIVFFPAQWILLQRPAWYPAAHSYRHYWAKIILFFWGVRYQIINPEYLKATHPVVICSNHSSYLDILVFCAVFSDDTRFMAKSELTGIPLFGVFFRTIDIEVARESKSESAMAYRKGVKALSLKQNLVIYPEGGIFPDPLKVKPFKDGAFQLALRQKVAILPVGLPDNYKIIPDEANYAKPGKIRVILHAPLRTDVLTLNDMNLLKATLHQILQNDLGL